MWVAGIREGGVAESRLLAKDGVYLHAAPRLVTSLPMHPGSRADVAIRCTVIGDYTLDTVLTLAIAAV